MNRDVAHPLHRLWAKIVDEASFGMINTLHRRHRSDFHLGTRLRAYIEEWNQISFADYYAPPEALSEVSLQALDRIELSDSLPSRLRFPSPFTSFSPVNDTAVFDLFPCAAGWSAPTLLMAHGLMSVSDVGYRRWAARLNRQGWNVIFVHLPYHYARRPSWTLSGELSVSADLVRTVEGARQSVIELRLLLQWLAKRGGTLFAGWGTSYGAWIMALLGCVEPLVQRLLLVEPILDIQAAIWQSPACIAIRATLRRRGITPEVTAPHLRLCCPLHASPCLDPRHILLLAGQFDQIAPPHLVRSLHQKWEGSHFYEFPQGHVGYHLLPESFRLAERLWPTDFLSATR